MHQKWICDWTTTFDPMVQPEKAGLAERHADTDNAAAACCKTFPWEDCATSEILLLPCLWQHFPYTSKRADHINSWLGISWSMVYFQWLHSTVWTLATRGTKHVAPQALYAQQLAAPFACRKLFEILDPTKKFFMKMIRNWQLLH